MGPLQGFKIIEVAGIGPTQFCGMLLADMGASVIRLTRPGGTDVGIGLPEKFNVMNRSRAAIAVDLKSAAGVDTVLRLCTNADAMFEGFRPGVMERLGLGPAECMTRNPKLVYGRMTGWGQTGPLSHAAGHDINYIALSRSLQGLGIAQVYAKPNVFSRCIQRPVEVDVDFFRLKINLSIFDQFLESGEEGILNE